MTVRSIVENWLFLWLCLACAVAYVWSAADPFVASKPYIAYMIVTIMFCIGSLLRTDEVRQVSRQWPRVLLGTLLQYSSMPVLAFLLASLFALPHDLWIGMMLVGCVPGAMASNVLTLMARGNVSYSISLTTVATLLSPLVVPFALWLLLQRHVQIDPLAVFVNLTWMVVAPVLLGFVMCRFLPRFAQRMQQSGPVIANLTILWLIGVIVAVNRANFGKAGITLVAALLILNLLGYSCGYFGSAALGFVEPMRRALTIEIGMQNAGLGATLALQLFPDQPASAIPAALYTFGCMMTGTLLARWWAVR